MTTAPRPASPSAPVSGVPSFEDSVRLFKLWGFQVEPGPEPEEVTLILEGPGYRTCAAYEARLLPEMAAVALRIRWQNWPLAPHEEAGGVNVGAAAARAVA